MNLSMTGIGWIVAFHFESPISTHLLCCLAKENTGIYCSYFFKLQLDTQRKPFHCRCLIQLNSQCGFIEKKVNLKSSPVWRNFKSGVVDVFWKNVDMCFIKCQKS